MYQLRELSVLFNKVVSILLAFFLFAFSFESEQESREIDHLREKLRTEFKKAGISGGDVQSDGRGKIQLAGVYRNYDEFIYALMLTYLIAGHHRVNPVYDTTVAIIKATTPELCFPYAIRGQDCPYGRVSIRKTQTLVKRPGGERFALVLGVSRFANKAIPPVLGADTDAEAFARYLQDKGYKVILLLNEEATLKRVKEEIERLYSKITDRDELVVYAASHGAPVDEKGEVGVVLYDSMATPRECMINAPPSIHAQAAKKMCSVVKNAFSIKDHILDTFADKKVKIVVLLDACYAGDALRRYLGISNPYVVATTREYERVLKAAPNLEMMITASSGDRQSWSMPLSDDFLNYLIDFTRGSPRYIQASRSKYKRDITFHGVFTAFLLESLVQRRDSLSEAYEISREPINNVSYRVCTKASRGDRDIRVEREETHRSECPPGGQNPQLFRVRGEDYNFGGKTRR